MTRLESMPPGPSGRVPTVRKAHRVLSRAHASFDGLFQAVEVLDDTRREANTSTKGRMSRVEVDVLRSAIVFTSAGLDAAMTRLVKDAGRHLVPQADSGAHRQFGEYLKMELAKPNVSDSFRTAVLSSDKNDALLGLYLAERTKASFQGSSDLRVRVRQTLGIPKSSVTDADFASLDEFFRARNKIAHEMDLEDADSGSTRRIHRRSNEVAGQCAQVFTVASALIRGAAGECRRSKR